MALYIAIVELRDYQTRAVETLFERYRSGLSRLVLVAPTGSGKTVMARAVVQTAVKEGHTVLAVTHRIELVEQLRSRLGGGVRVESVQGLLASGERPTANFLLWDECQHVAAGVWSSVAMHYCSALHMGLTATPERADGKPLGDIYEDLVVAAKHSELLADGWLVPARLFFAKETLDSGRLAQGPVEAWTRHAKGTRAFVFCRNVKDAYRAAEAFQAAGVTAKCVEASTPPEERAAALAAFRAGTLTVLCNVYLLTEGIDVPDAQTAIIARGIGHPSTYLQMVGRVLRPAPGKDHAIVLDLVGVFHAHGHPTEDREYSLTGDAITSTSKTTGLTVCQACGYTFPSAPACPNCGFERPKKKVKPQLLLAQQLQEYYAGPDTPDRVKLDELDALRKLAWSRGWRVWQIVKRYQLLFGSKPPGSVFTEAERKREFNALLGDNRGEKYALARYKAMFGCWPRRSDVHRAG